MAELRHLAATASSLRLLPTSSPEHTRWTARVLSVLEEVFGRKSRYYLSFSELNLKPVLIPTAGPNSQLLHLQYLSDLGAAEGLLLAAADHLERADIASVYEGKDTPPESSAIIKVINLAGPKLRRVIRSSPKSEKEVQDSFETLLVGADVLCSREADRIEYSSKTYAPDFTLPQIGLAIEIKLCATPAREKEIIAEINDDILAYQTKYGNILFVVYDLGHIRDVERFTASLEQHENVVVRVVKH